MASVGSVGWWVGFNLFVLVFLVLDLVVFNRQPHQVRIREAAIWSIVFVVMALVFCVGIYFTFGSKPALEFLAGYIVEKSLSVDNLFVFLLILGHFAVPNEFQHRVLYAGIVGALVMRIGFILAGTALLAKFHFILYVFGAFLVYTGVKMLVAKEGEEPNLDDNRVMKLMRRIIPMSSTYDGPHFFTVQNGKRVATPMLAVLIMIETSDVVFATDSIPAILAISQDPFIVYTSNIFAILGLRAMFFLLLGVLKSLRYLKVGLAIILSFIGVKMLISDYYHVPISISLGVIAVVLTTTVVLSAMANKRDRAAHGRMGSQVSAPGEAGE